MRFDLSHLYNLRPSASRQTTAITFRTAFPARSTRGQALLPANPPSMQTKIALKSKAHRCTSLHRAADDHRRTAKNASIAHRTPPASAIKGGMGTFGMKTREISTHHGIPSRNAPIPTCHGSGALREGVSAGFLAFRKAQPAIVGNAIVKSPAMISTG